jgi:hypothetical protein
MRSGLFIEHAVSNFSLCITVAVIKVADFGRFPINFHIG